MDTRESGPSRRREASLGRALVDLTDTLVENFNVLDYRYARATAQTAQQLCQTTARVRRRASRLQKEAQTIRRGPDGSLERR